MAEPLDYRNPRNSNAAPGYPVPAQPVAAIPLEFELLLTRTQDLAAARAIEVELARKKIDVFRHDRGGDKGQDVELYIRAADRDRAAPVARQIFFRRKRIKSFPPIGKDNAIDLGRRMFDW